VHYRLCTLSCRRSCINLSRRTSREIELRNLPFTKVSDQIGHSHTRFNVFIESSRSKSLFPSSTSPAIASFRSSRTMQLLEEIISKRRYRTAAQRNNAVIPTPQSQALRVSDVTSKPDGPWVLSCRIDDMRSISK
jgi:hypothetical protein